MEQGQDGSAMIPDAVNQLRRKGVETSEKTQYRRFRTITLFFFF